MHVIKQIFFGIFVIVTLTLIVSTLYLVAWGKLFPPGITYDCSIPLPLTVSPPCSVFREDSVPSTFEFSFFTSNTISQTVSLPNTTQVDPYLYYYGHPAATLFRDTDSLYSFPFIAKFEMSEGKPIVDLLPYQFSSQAEETVQNPFKQFAYPLLVPSSSPNRCRMTFNDLTDQFTKNSSTGTTTYRPFLNTIVSSGDISLMFCQGVPYMTMRSDSATTFDVSVESLAMYETGTIGAYRYYFIWNNEDKSNASIFLLDSSLTVSVTYVGFVFRIIVTLTSNNQYMYVTMMKTNDVETMHSVLTTFVRYLVPPIIQIQDVHVSGQKTYIQYSGTTVVGSHGMIWIIPTNMFIVSGLNELAHTPDAFGFPTGRGIFVTSPTTDGTTAESFSFYNMWDLVDLSSDFNYQLPYKNVEDGQVVIETYNDMYELSTTLRVMTASDIDFNREFMSSCITYWKTELNSMLYDDTYKTAYFATLGTEMGYISKFSYLLLTYINLFVICSSGIIPTASSPYLTVMSDQTTEQIKTIIETTLVTTGTHIGIQYFDFYNCTFPNISDNEGETYYSRMGEVLSFIWACNYIVRHIFGQHGSAAAELSGALFSIVATSNIEFVRGNCSWIQVSPELPWNGLYRNNAIGFQLDPKATRYMGKSPDSVYLESFIPFSPPTHHIMRPIMKELFIAVSKSLRCLGIYNGFIDPEWVYFTLYVFEDEDYSSILTTTSTTFPEKNDFVDKVETTYPLTALLMNLRKLPK